MEIILADHAGFCEGVRRAVCIAKDAAREENKRVFTLGDIVHNDFVVEDLVEAGVIPKTLEELLSLKDETVIIKSHGTSKKTISDLSSCGHRVIDATCPFVKKVHQIVERYSGEGYDIIVLGENSHDEVRGTLGWVQGSVFVISSPKEAEDFSEDKNKKYCLVSQTTFNHNKFKECVEILNKKGYDILALDTICSATDIRQREAEEIASKVGAMIVIGDPKSSNSRKLFEVACGRCKTFFLQTKADLDPSVLNSIASLGITAGASTPDFLIREVMIECQK